MKRFSPDLSSLSRLRLLLVALAVLVYANSLRNGFTIDDEFVYSDNQFVRHLSNLPHLFDHGYFTYSNEASYRPVCTFTYFLDAALWKNWTMGPHLTNLVMFAGIVLVLFSFLESITHNRRAAFFGAVVFAVHPIHAEVVDNISFREDLLIALWLPAAWLWYKRSERGRPWIWMPLAWLAYFLATLSKEMAVMFPLLVLLLEFTDADARVRSLIEPRRIVYMAGLLAVTLLFVGIRFHWMQFPGEAHLPKLGGSLVHEIMAATKINADYLLLFVCPFRLRVSYPVSLYQPALDRNFLFSAGALLVVLAFLVYFWRNRVFVFGLLWWFLCLAPVSNLYPIFNPMAERYLFLPSIGLSAWVGWLFARGMEGRRRAAMAAVAVVIVLALAVTTFLRTPAWHDNYSLWHAEAQTDPLDPAVVASLAQADFEAGQYAHAIEHGERALDLRGESPEHLDPGPVYLCIGSAYMMLAKPDLALENLNRAASYIPMRFDIDAAVYRNLGLIYDDQNQLSTAVSYYQKAAAIDPFRADLWRKIAYCELRLGNRSQAEADWEKAHNLDRSLPTFEQAEHLYKSTTP